MNRSKFWNILTITYFICLGSYILAINPDMTEVKNSALLLPLYVGIVFSLVCKEENRNKTALKLKWRVSACLLSATALVVVFKLIAVWIR